ncbi:MAG TPA: hypothetical protein VFC18_13680 [Burkholderiales bacterium]|nr:hypothetical protein [Burkholderiales bacterium]
MKRPDLGNRLLAIMVAGGVSILVVYFAVIQPALPLAWRTPGSPELYLTGVAGAALLLVSMGFVLAKRTGRGGSAPAWFVAHVVGGTAGAVLVAVHSAGFLRRPPALLFLALIALVLLGVWARTHGASRMAATFATKRASFAPADPAKRQQFAQIIAAKRALLARIDREANEGVFSITLTHWLRSPRISWQYSRLMREENRLMGTRASVGFEQAWWRPLHLALAYVFILGLLVHVVTVTFLAGYVADGGPITWWHLKDW